METRLPGSGAGAQAGTVTTTENSSVSAVFSFGTSRSLVQRYSYTGREFNEASGDYYFRFREFGPDWGQFFTSDPLGYGTGWACMPACSLGVSHGILTGATCRFAAEISR